MPQLNLKETVEMQRSLLIGLSQSLAMVSVGLVVGGIAGWIGLLLADGPQPVAAIIARCYLSLVLILPATLLWLNLKPEDQTPYSELLSALLILIVASVVGSVVASVFFFAPAVNVPHVFGGENNMQIALALKQELRWDKFAIVLGVTFISSIFIAIWTHKQAKNQMTGADDSNNNSN